MCIRDRVLIACAPHAAGLRRASLRHGKGLHCRVLRLEENRKAAWDVFGVSLRRCYSGQHHVIIIHIIHVSQPADDELVKRVYRMREGPRRAPGAMRSRAWHSKGWPAFHASCRDKQQAILDACF